jgi:hypothetical protein
LELLAFVMHYLVLVIPNKKARAAFKKAVVLAPDDPRMEEASVLK